MMIGNFPPTWQSGKPTLRAKNDLYLCKAVVLAKTINASLAARDKTLIRVKDLKLLCAAHSKPSTAALQIPSFSFDIHSNCMMRTREARTLQRSFDVLSCSVEYVLEHLTASGVHHGGGGPQ